MQRSPIRWLQDLNAVSVELRSRKGRADCRRRNAAEWRVGEGVSGLVESMS